MEILRRTRVARRARRDVGTEEPFVLVATSSVTKATRQRDERGAVLVLALIYVVAIGLIVGTLANWAASSLDNTTHFQSGNELHYALTSATNNAIESIRYAPIPTNPTTAEYAGQATPLGECWAPSSGTTSQLTLDGYTVDVWCTTTITLNNTTANDATRTVTVYSCLSSLSAAQCQATPYLTAEVAFDDYPDQGGVTLTEQCNLESGQCGYGQTLLEWTWN